MSLQIISNQPVIGRTTWQIFDNLRCFYCAPFLPQALACTRLYDRLRTVTSTNWTIWTNTVRSKKKRTTAMRQIESLSRPIPRTHYRRCAIAPVAKVRSSSKAVNICRPNRSIFSPYRILICELEHLPIKKHQIKQRDVFYQLCKAPLHMRSACCALFCSCNRCIANNALAIQVLAHPAEMMFAVA